MTAPVVRVRDLELSAGGRPLLEGASLEIGEGELCLLVGASGTGKTLTLALLAGLWKPGQGTAVRGRVEVLGEDAIERRHDAAIPGTGIVFQDFALLDDLDARGNVEFGLDHGPTPPEDAAAEAERRLEEFGLPPRIRPARMSGGMKQRLALARTMAFSPRLVFYDEPTSGLDPAMSRRVASRLREVHDRHGMTTVVVTHDLHSLARIADRILLLDPRRRDFVEVPATGLDRAMSELEGFRPADEDPLPPPPPIWRAAPVRFLEGAGTFVIGAGRTLASLVPRYPRRRWGLRFLWRFLRLATLGTAIPFLSLAGFITGFVVTYFMFRLLPLQGFTEPVLVEEFIGSLGYALYRVVVPGITTLLFASRSGAAIAADIGNRVLTRQVDALRSHGIPPDRYLLSGVAIASVLGIPLLFVLADFFAQLAAVGVFLASHPGHGPLAFREEFGRLLGTWGPLPGGSQYVLGKLLLSALGTAGIAYHAGIQPKPSGADVAGAVTTTIIRATIFVLTVHAVFAFFEF